MSRFLDQFLAREPDPQKNDFSGTPLPKTPENPKNQTGDCKSPEPINRDGGFSPFSTFSGQGTPKNSFFEGGQEPPSPSGPDPLERKARALLEEAKRTPGVTITDEEKALALYRSIARLAARGEDEEREAIQTEERGRVVDLATHRRTIEGLLRAASPVASLPGAVRCRRCGAGVWVSPSWPGPRPTLCRECEKEGLR